MYNIIIIFDVKTLSLLRRLCLQKLFAVSSSKEVFSNRAFFFRNFHKGRMVSLDECKKKKDGTNSSVIVDIRNFRRSQFQLL